MSKEPKSETAWARWRYEQIRKAKIYAAKVLDDPDWVAKQDARYRKMMERR